MQPIFFLVHLIATTAAFLHIKRHNYLRTLSMSAFTKSSESSLRQNLSRLSKLPLKKQKAVQSILGSAVADAATRPFHWVYNRTVLEETVNGAEEVEFWSESISPFYTLPTGRRSCYNDLSVVTLRSFSKNEERSALFCKESFIESMKDMFGPGSEYAKSLEIRRKSYGAQTKVVDRVPIDGPWQQAASINFMDEVLSGKEPTGSPESRESDGLCITLPLIARLSAAKAAPTEEDISLLYNTAKLISSNSTSLSHSLSSGMILIETIQGSLSSFTISSLKEIVAKLASRYEIVKQGDGSEDNILKDLDFGAVLNELDSLEHYMDVNFVDAVEKLGKPCAYPGSFLGAILSVLQESRSAATDPTHEIFKKVVRKIILSGGCNCSKANFAGAIVAAMNGFTIDDPTCDCVAGNDLEGLFVSRGGIPISWLKKTDRIDEILERALDAIENL